MTVALVTGATAGIGLEFCERFAARGHDLVIVARDQARLRATATTLTERHGVEVEVLPADLADRAGLARVADRVRDPGRPVEILVNNAGFGLGRDILDSPLADEERLLDVLVRAVLVLSHAAGGAMRERGSGTIVNVSSVAGWMATGSYAAAKAWVTTFTEALAGQLAGSGVQVTALCPGMTRTEFHSRASLDPGAVPGFAWLSAAEVVDRCLADVEAGRTLSVPGPAYRALRHVLRVAPRRVVRSQALTSRRR